MVLTPEYEAEAQAALTQLQSTYGTTELDKSDIVVLMDGWNKVLAWETMWKEACWMRWRILAAREELMNPLLATSKKQVGDAAVAARLARNLVEENKDPIAECFGGRSYEGRNMILALFDEQVRSFCPHRQTVQREAYRNVTDDFGASFGLTLECKTAKDFFRLFSTLGVRPRHWLTLCEAFMWTMSTHSPYADDADVEDFEKKPMESAFARFAAERVAKVGIKDSLALREYFSSPLYTTIYPEFWHWVKNSQDSFGEMFYSNLLSSYPDLLDYFARADMDSLAGHIIQAIDLMTKYPTMVGEYQSSFRQVMKHLGDMHLELGIATDAYPMIGANLVHTLKSFTKEYCYKSRGTEHPVTVNELENAVITIYGDTMAFTFYPMLREEHMVAKATEFFETVADELDWSPAKLNKRMLKVKLEINASGTYQHTSEEIEIGARLAWRNSVKCIGRISWNTLMVRDCRHVETSKGIIHEIEKHLEIATAGTNLQSVMSVFRPKKPNEAWGIKFWTTQLVRYACYVDEDGNTMGDTANKHITKYLIEKGLWTPPEPRTQHDVLPVVFKMPGVDEPIVHQFDPKYVDEAAIEHPSYPEVAKLGHKWASVPAITDFNMNLGGVDYGCMPFNGWFASVEIVRDFMERYQGCSEKWAAAMGIDIKNLRMWKARVAHEIDVAVLHSFDKAGYTIVDPDTVGEQFMTHCKREREAGRECPAQWSWIGGLTGPINKTWHKEMRDFRANPQYEYCCEMYSVTGEDEIFQEGATAAMPHVDSSPSLGSAINEEAFTIPRVLIAYGSETGTAEAAAGRLARVLRICKPLVKNLNDVAGLDIIRKRKITHLLVLCSTFGKGKPPTTANVFFETDIPDDILQNTEFATLALGSSMYPDFCAAGKKVDKLLAQAGGVKLSPLKTADEAVDSAGTVAQWIKLVKDLVLPASLEAAIEEMMEGANEPLKYQMKWELEPSPHATVSRFEWPAEQSSLCRINEELLVGGDVTKRSTRRIGFEVPPGSSYVTGDHLAINPLNSMEMVNRFAACFRNEFEAFASSKGIAIKDTDELLSWQLQQPFEVECIDNGQVYPAQVNFSSPSTLAKVLQAGLSLSLSESSAGDLITVLAKYVPSEDSEVDGTVKKFNELAALILEGGKGSENQDAMDSFLSLYPTVVDLLEVFCPILDKVKRALPLADVLAILPRLQPRLYSISSSSMTSPEVVEVSVGVVHAYTKDGVHIKGVCSNYLARLKPMESRAKVSIRTSSFRGPEDICNTPMIMVGAGTGLAPMMGFLHDRAHVKKETKANGDVNCHLFFGCRTHDERMYRDKISQWEDEKVLNLHLAMSRSPDRPKMYVQDMVKEKGEILSELFQRDDCTYYVCGDANMADYCYEAIVEVLREHGHMSRSKATLLLKRMRVEDRWQYDLWGISSYMDDNSYSDAKKKAAKRHGNKALAWLSKMKKTDDEDDDWSFRDRTPDNDYNETKSFAGNGQPAKATSKATSETSPATSETSQATSEKSPLSTNLRSTGRLAI